MIAMTFEARLQKTLQFGLAVSWIPLGEVDFKESPITQAS